MISDFEKKNDGDDSKSNSENFFLYAADLSKKPIGVRRNLEYAATLISLRSLSTFEMTRHAVEMTPHLNQ